VDLRQETGDAGWLVPTNQLDMAGRNSRWYGRVGLYEGCMWIETPRAPVFVNASNDAGSTGNIDVYATIICGREALSMAYSSVEHGPEPTFVVGPITDTLRRFHTFGWKWFGGFGRFRDVEELYRIESASTIGNNAS
jgi:N4-gp56 family major capsid protein